MIPQGAAAAGTFSSKGLIAGAYADGSETHKTTEEVEAYWMKQIESERASAAAEGRETSLPYGFDQREKMRAAEAKAYGAADAAGGASSAYGGATPGFINRPATAPRDSDAPAAAFARSDRHAPDAAAAPSSRLQELEAEKVAAETALLRVATHTLETLAATLRAKPVPLDAEDRAAFAAAVKKSLDAVLHCR